MASVCAADPSGLSPVDFIQLQEYMEYSSMKVRDVLKDFNAGGKLVHHRFGERIDAEGFSLFLKTYLEVDDFPADLSHRLYRYFQFPNTMLLMGVLVPKTIERGVMRDPKRLCKML